jgi:cytoskeleton protein RodZ
MPEILSADESAQPGIEASPAALTAGQMLKAARIRAGVHLGVLSTVIKVPVRKLEALEADRYQPEHSPAFARGLASAVCRHLRTDPGPILALMPQATNFLDANGTVRHAYSEPANLGHVHHPSGGLPVRALWAAVGMLLVIAALLWLPNPAHWQWPEQAAAYFSNSDKPSNGAAGDSTANVEMPAVPSVATDPSAMGAVTVVPNELSTPAPVPKPLGTATDRNSDLVMTATDTSWVEVRDLQNQLIWTGILNAGDTHRVPVLSPVKLVLGRANAIQLVHKGQALDIRPFTQANTARFEVKP